MQRPSRYSRFLRVVAGAAVVFVIVVVVLVAAAWRSFGKSADGARAQRMAADPHHSGNTFVNPQPLHNDAIGSLTAMWNASAYVSPHEPVDVVVGNAQRFATPPPSGLRVTWFGHSTQLVEIDGKRVLTDPIFSDRASPFGFVGPHRWYAPPVALPELPPIDVVVFSHDHYDHLDRATVEAMAGWNTTFVAPLGVGAHLEYWGVPPARIVELAWWDEAHVGDLTITCVPARHASGRHLLDLDHTLWAGYAVKGTAHNVYYSGDTGLFPGMADIGAKLGPFDATLIEVGQYDPAWPDWHIGPEQAVRAHQMVRGKVMIPVHWALFPLAAHGWTEPGERAAAAAAAAGVDMALPRPGESIEPTLPHPSKRWWPPVPWLSAAERPIVSSQMDSAAR